MPRKTTTDAELQAMIAIASLLHDLTDDEAARVLRWVDGRWGHLGHPVVTASFPGQPDKQLGGHLDGRPVGAATGNAGDPRRDEP